MGDRTTSPYVLTLLALGVCALLFGGCAHRPLRPAASMESGDGDFSARLVAVAVSPRHGPAQLTVEVRNTGPRPLTIAPTDVQLVAPGTSAKSAVPLVLEAGEAKAARSLDGACLAAGVTCAGCAGITGILAIALGEPEVGIPLACGATATGAGLFGLRKALESRTPEPLVLAPGEQGTLSVESTDTRIGAEPVELLVPSPEGTERALRVPVGISGEEHLGFAPPSTPPYMVGARLAFGALTPLSEHTPSSGVVGVGLFAGLEGERFGASIDAAIGTTWMVGGALRWTALRAAGGAVIPWIGYGRYAVANELQSDGWMHGQGPRFGVDLLAFLDSRQAFGWNLGENGLGASIELAPLRIEREPLPLQPARLVALQSTVSLTAAIF